MVVSSLACLLAILVSIWRFGWPNCRLANCLAVRLIGLLIGYLADLPIGWQIGWLSDGRLHRFADWHSWWGLFGSWAC